MKRKAELAWLKTKKKDIFQFNFDAEGNFAMILKFRVGLGFENSKEILTVYTIKIQEMD
ncbi:hypothetical protein N4T20_07495 [Flavobacterium sp. TR2]|uniref:hypothetical protein n=1 Tax=Flavobacterium sp. TR2 TaxID=2977321 RepID=UPI0021B12849|nr:hypothetical protein [Flavobacterium sp. TR2]UWY29780.1 hypothetical protein N4T20_07495 [Flavobacterium sp. TR2]